MEWFRAIFMKAVGPLLAFLIKEFRAAILSLRFGIISGVVGAAILIIAWQLGMPALASAGRDADPTNLHLWQRGSDGALAGLGFLIPLFLPVLPVFLVRESLKADERSGLLSLVLTKPSVSGFVAVGKSVGLMAALSVPVTLISISSVFLIQLIVGLPVEASLGVTFVASNLLLAGLYLALALVIGLGKSPAYVGSLSFLSWLGFNVLRPTAFELLGQMIGALPLGRIVSFEYAWTDTLSFTGFAHGFLASALPGTFGFVAGPREQVLPVLPWSALAWLIGLVALHMYLLRRLPSR
jgi:hypothetical protein